LVVNKFARGYWPVMSLLQPPGSRPDARRIYLPTASETASRSVTFDPLERLAICREEIKSGHNGGLRVSRRTFLGAMTVIVLRAGLRGTQRASACVGQDFLWRIFRPRGSGSAAQDAKMVGVSRAGLTEAQRPSARVGQQKPGRNFHEPEQNSLKP
jgi:hypothetical protein